ncbi:hypothetical protein EAE96_009649 [Botrytis aclada]|nr:hypothetical protein EAE96_009649 [Botrytis aclada]
MDYSNFYQSERSNLRAGLDKRIVLITKKVWDQNHHGQATEALRKLYAFYIAKTYFDEATHKFASVGWTRKDIDDIHRDILNIKYIPDQLLNGVYIIVHTPEANIAEVISYFLKGKPIPSVLLKTRVRDASQANFVWQIIRLNTLFEEFRIRLRGDWDEVNSRLRIGIAV